MNWGIFFLLSESGDCVLCHTYVMQIPTSTLLRTFACPCPDDLSHHSLHLVCIHSLINFLICNLVVLRKGKATTKDLDQPCLVKSFGASFPSCRSNCEPRPIIISLGKSSHLRQLRNPKLA